MIDAPAAFREVSDFAKCFGRERRIWIAAALAFCERNSPRQRDAEAKIENPHRRPTLPKQEPDAEFLLRQIAEQHGHEEQTKQNRYASAKPCRRSAKRNSTGNTHRIRIEPVALKRALPDFSSPLSKEQLVDLSIYDNSDFDRGAPLWKEALWAFARWIFFQNALSWPSSLRVALLEMFGAKIGRHVIIRANVNISFPWRLQVDDHVWIGEDVGILSLAQVTIESNVCVGQRAYLCTGSHEFRREDFKLKVAPIAVRTGSWVAAAAFIGPGVEIGAGSVVSAGSVVLENVPANVLVQGNPARVVSAIDRETTAVSQPIF